MPIVPMNDPGDFPKRGDGNRTLVEINREIHFYEKGANYVLSEPVDTTPVNTHWFVFVDDPNPVNKTQVQLAADPAPKGLDPIWNGKMWVSGVKGTAVKAYRAK